MRVMLALLSLAWMGQVWSHDAARPDLTQWMLTLHDRYGSPCCDGSDAMVGVEWESHNGHYRVRIDDAWQDVPDKAVITSPNLEGRAMVWWFFINGRRNGIRCFLPGTMS